MSYELATLWVSCRRDIIGRYLRHPLGPLLVVANGVVLAWLGTGAVAAALSAVVWVAVGLAAQPESREGFLQTILLGPGSRAALALGKVLAAVVAGVLTVVVFVGTLVVLGADLAAVRWLPFMALVTLVATTASGLAVGLARMFERPGRFAQVSLAVVVPAWLLAGTLFSVPEAVRQFNPMARVDHAMTSVLLGTPVAWTGLVLGAIGAVSIGVAFWYRPVKP